MKTGRKSVFYVVAFLVAVQIGVVYKWNWFCTNFEAHRHVYKMCSLYQEGTADGTLCSPLCTTRDIYPLTCFTRHTTKESVFGGKRGESRLVFKSTVANVPALHWYDNGALKYPTEKGFLSTVRAVTMNMLNQSLPSETLDRLTHLAAKRKDKGTDARQLEMDNIWVLVQDNEYLLTNAYWDRDVFPQILGTCGPYFAVEYVEPIGETFSVLYEMDTRENWKRNVRYSVYLMELLEELENNFKEPLHLCDVKLGDFGVTSLENGRAKVLDLDTVYPKSVISRFVKEIGPCSRDEDCKFLDCRGRCDKKRGKCDRAVTNNNLQIVCEKIFLGWRMSNTVLIPGLLLSRFAPDELMAVLRQCANPENEENKVPRAAAGDDTRKRLYSILVDIEQGANTDTFL